MAETWSMLSWNRTRSLARSWMYTNQCSKTGTVLSLEVKMRYSLVTALYCTSFLSPIFPSFLYSSAIFCWYFKNSRFLLGDKIWSRRLKAPDWSIDCKNRQRISPEYLARKIQKSSSFLKNFYFSTHQHIFLVLLKRHFGEFFFIIFKQNKLKFIFSFSFFFLISGDCKICILHLKSLFFKMIKIVCF